MATGLLKCYIKEGRCPHWWLFSQSLVVRFVYHRGILSKYDPESHYRMTPLHYVKRSLYSAPARIPTSGTSINHSVNMVSLIAPSDSVLVVILDYVALKPLLTKLLTMTLLSISVTIWRSILDTSEMEDLSTPGPYPKTTRTHLQ